MADTTTPRFLTLDELPRSQKSLANLAEENGWYWRCDFCEPDSYVLRFRRIDDVPFIGDSFKTDYRAAVAYWSKGKFVAAYRGNPRTRLKSAELKEYLKQ